MTNDPYKKLVSYSNDVFIDEVLDLKYDGDSWEILVDPIGKEDINGWSPEKIWDSISLFPDSVNRLPLNKLSPSLVTMALSYDPSLLRSINRTFLADNQDFIVTYLSNHPEQKDDFFECDLEDYQTVSKETRLALFNTAGTLFFDWLHPDDMDLNKLLLTLKNTGRGLNLFINHHMEIAKQNFEVIKNQVIEDDGILLANIDALNAINPDWIINNADELLSRLSYTLNILPLEYLTKENFKKAIALAKSEKVSRHYHLNRGQWDFYKKYPETVKDSFYTPFNYLAIPEEERTEEYSHAMITSGTNFYWRNIPLDHYNYHVLKIALEKLGVRGVKFIFIESFLKSGILNKDEIKDLAKRVKEKGVTSTLMEIKVNQLLGES